jgi:putative hydrolase of the HAD superfamily
MGLVEGVAFDLDDTLYLECHYVRSGFQRVAEELGARGAETERIFSFLESQFDAGIFSNAFDRLIAAFPDLEFVCNVDELVDLYRSHRPAITLIDGVSSLLGELNRSGIRLALITDGSVVSQSNKIAALAIDQLFEPIYITDSWGVEFRKPHLLAFQAVEQNWGIIPEKLAYIGDNPAKDFYAPRRLGWQTVRLRLERQLRHGLEASSPEFTPAREFGTVEELSAWLHLNCAMSLRVREGSREWQPN